MENAVVWQDGCGGYGLLGGVEEMSALERRRDQYLIVFESRCWTW